MAPKLGEVAETTPKPPRVQSVARATDILNMIAASPEGATAQEISRALGLKRATVYHLLHTLGSAGYVTQGPERRYRIGLGVGSLVAAFERQVVPGGFFPLARELAAQTGETAYVAMRQRDQMMLLCSVPGHHTVGVAVSPIGPIEEGHARASGKLLLALAPEEVRDAYLATHPLKRITSSTITRKDALLNELDRIRADGYATDVEEFIQGVACVAAPIGTGASALVIVLSAPLDRFDAQREAYVAAAVSVGAAGLAS
jgi:IclR family transcriptional regulator, acetate operon repressor